MDIPTALNTPQIELLIDRTNRRVCHIFIDLPLLRISLLYVIRAISNTQICAYDETQPFFVTSILQVYYTHTRIYILIIYSINKLNFNDYSLLSQSTKFACVKLNYRLRKMMRRFLCLKGCNAILDLFAIYIFSPPLEH